MEYENFNDVKVGDKVYVPRGNGGILCEVKRVTKAQFMTLARTFRKSDGKMLNSSRFYHAVHATPEMIEKVNKAEEFRKLVNEFSNALQILENIEFNKIQKDDFVAIVNIAKKYK